MKASVITVLVICRFHRFSENSHLFVLEKIIEDFRKISDINAKEGSTLVFRENKSMHISVKISEQRSIVLKIEPGDTTEDIMKKIEEEEGIPVKKQLLTFRGKIFCLHFSLILLKPLMLLHTADFRRRT